MNISDYTYNLSDEKIAIYPPKIRGTTKLLVLNRDTGEIEHKKYSDIADYLNPGDLLILNNTKVIKARLYAETEKGKKIELIILEKHKNEPQNLALYRGKIKKGEVLKIKNVRPEAGLSMAEKLKIENIVNGGIIEFRKNLDLTKIVEKFGDVPIPPYLKRESEKLDEDRYQTVFAKEKGSVAAPTASLNFTEELKQKLINKGVQIHYITLHVGLGTFLPIRTDRVEDHIMHKEFYSISVETLNAIRKAFDVQRLKLKDERSTNNAQRSIVALGTTVTRALEHAAPRIFDLKENDPIEDEADIFIYPGYKFKIVNKLITNFHAPKSTVLMLTAAFAGWPYLQNAYQEALENDYKFLSYGDSMMII